MHVDNVDFHVSVLVPDKGHLLPDFRSAAWHVMYAKVSVWSEDLKVDWMAWSSFGPALKKGTEKQATYGIESDTGSNGYMWYRSDLYH